MRGFLPINFNTPTELVPSGYANAEFTSAVSSTHMHFSNQDDKYDDDEEYEKEWCD